MDSTKIKRWLYDNEKSQRELAEKIGVSPATLTNLMKNRRQPRLDAFKRLCEVTGIDPKELW